MLRPRPDHPSPASDAASSVIIRDIVPPASLATDLYHSVYLPVVRVWERAAENIMGEYGRTLAATLSDGASGGVTELRSGVLVPVPVAQPRNAVQKVFTARGYPGREASLDTADSNRFSARLTVPADIQARLDAASSELERLFILLDAALRDWGVRVERWQREKWRGAVLSATGVDIGTPIGPEDMRETVGTYLEWNANLVRDISAQTRQRISDAVFAGLRTAQTQPSCSRRPEPSKARQL